MEGVVFGLRQGLDLMIEMGTPLERILASGGATRHPLWLQLQADIFQRPVYASSTEEATARGAALLAGIGAKVYQDSWDAVKQTVQAIGNPVLPQPENANRYEDIYRTYCQIYPALKNSGL